MPTTQSGLLWVGSTLKNSNKMPNEEHVKLIRQGVEVWNAWRGENFAILLDNVETKYSAADLSAADLSGADLSGANLNWVSLVGANLRGANLSGANLAYSFL